MHNTFDKFTKGRHNMNLILGDQREKYNNVGSLYQPKNNAHPFEKTPMLL